MDDLLVDFTETLINALVVRYNSKKRKSGVIVGEENEMIWNLKNNTVFHNKMFPFLTRPIFSTNQFLVVSREKKNDTVKILLSLLFYDNRSRLERVQWFTPSIYTWPVRRLSSLEAKSPTSTSSHRRWLSSASSIT